MRRAIKGMLFSLPLLVYVALFFLYEPYNFYGLRKVYGDTGSVAAILKRLHENTEAENLLLGASRTADLYPEYLKEHDVISEPWLNLSMTGSSIEERYWIFQDAVHQNTLKKVVIPIGFYGMNTVNGNRFAEGNPGEVAKLSGFNYFFSSSSQYAAVQKMLETPIIQRIEEVDFHSKLGFTIPLIDNASTESFWKKKYSDYIARVWQPQIDAFMPQTESIARLIELIYFCKEKNIELDLVTMPMQQACFDILRLTAVEDISSFYKDFLSLYTCIYDMEYEESAWTKQYGFFLDGLHLNGINFVHGENPIVEDVYKTLFTQNGREMQVLQNEQSIQPLFTEYEFGLSGSGMLETYIHPIKIKDNSVYIFRFHGKLPKDAEVFYCDLYDSLQADPVLPGRNIGIPVQIDGTDEYILFFRTKGLINKEVQFRMVYIGQEDIQIDSMEVLRYCGINEQ